MGSLIGTVHNHVFFFKYQYVNSSARILFCAPFSQDETWIQKRPNQSIRPLNLQKDS